MVAYTEYRRDGRVRLEAESLVSWGYEVCFLVPKDSATPRTFTVSGVTVRELNVQKYGGKSKLNYVLSYTGFLVLAFFACTRLFFQTHIKVVHVHNMPDVLVFAGLIPRLLGCKLVLDVHDTVPETYEAKFGTISRLLSGLLRLEEWICCSFVHKIICVNHVQAEALIKRGIPAEKISIVITMPRFGPPARSSHQKGQAQVFRMVNHGTMATRLGNDLIIQAAAKLVHKIPGFELHIIGEGDGLDGLVKLSESLGLRNQVNFHRTVPWDQLAKKLEIMDVGIVANRINAATDLMLPSKLIDFVALGIPAIVPRLRAIQYYFTPDMVSYFEPENIESMVETTLRVYEDKDGRERRSRNARSFLERYDWDAHPDGLKGLYADL
jgi:glycosyltransferase involved in cell wall biosynthesis